MSECRSRSAARDTFLFSDLFFIFPPICHLLMILICFNVCIFPQCIVAPVFSRHGPVALGISSRKRFDKLVLFVLQLSMFLQMFIQCQCFILFQLPCGLPLIPTLRIIRRCRKKWTYTTVIYKIYIYLQTFVRM